MKEKTLLMVENEINEFFKSEKCKEIIKKYRSDTQHECHPPFRINTFLEDINSEIANIDSRIFICYPMDKSWLFFTHNFESVYLKYNLPDGKEEKIRIGTFVVDTYKSSIGSVCDDGSNLSIRFDTEYVLDTLSDGFHYTTRKYCSVADVIRRIIKKRKREIIKEINQQIKSERNSIKMSEKQISKNTEYLNSVRKW